jgi:hypothetical protein
MSKKNHNVSGANIASLAKQATETLNKLQSSLPLDDDLLAHDRKVANIRKGVSTAAIETAVSILTEIGDKAGAFDLEGTREALAYETELSAVVLQARSLANRIETTISKRRSKAVATTSGLLRSLQGLARSDGSVIPHVERLAPFLRKRGKKVAATAGANAPAPSDATTQPKIGNGPIALPSVTIAPAGVIVDVAPPGATNGAAKAPTANA